MPTISFSSPLEVALAVGLTALMAVLAVLLWRSLQQRSRRHGGGTLAAVIMAVAVVVLLISITPGVLPQDIALFVLIASALAIYKPAQIVKLTGGPNLRWRALREGRELQLLVKERGDPVLAARNPELKERYDALGALEGPGTETYIGLLRETLFADPAARGMAAKLEQLADADAALRASLGGRPTWERELERRAAEGPPPADEDQSPPADDQSPPADDQASDEGQAPAR